MYSRKVSGAKGKVTWFVSIARFCWASVLENFFIQEGLWIASLEEGTVKVAKEIIQGIRIITNAMASNGKGVGKGAFSVERMTTAEVKVLLLIRGFYMDRGEKFVVG